MDIGKEKKMIEKEIWIKVMMMEQVEKVRADIWGLKDRFQGNCKIFIYVDDIKEVKVLPETHRLNEYCIPVLVANYKE